MTLRPLLKVERRDVTLRIKAGSSATAIPARMPFTSRRETWKEEDLKGPTR